LEKHWLLLFFILDNSVSVVKLGGCIDVMDFNKLGIGQCQNLGSMVR